MSADLKPYPEMKDSGVEWLGEVPEHWQVSMTKRHYDIRLGKMLQRTPSGPYDVEVPYLRAKDVQWFSVQVTDASRMWASLAELDQFGVKPGDLLVCEGGEGGRCGILKHKVDGYIIQNALHRVRPRLESRNDYLQYVMMSVAATGWFEALNDKATIAHFTREKFGSLQIQIPSGDEQAAIVRFLDHVGLRIQRYIRAREKLVALLEEQKQAIIHEAVTGRIDVRTGKPYPAYKPSGIEWLGEVPADWGEAPLGRCLRHIAQGWSPTAAEGELEPNQWAVLALSSVKRGMFDATAIKPIPISAKIPEGIEIENGDLLLTRSNTRELVGDVCIVEGARPKTVISDLIYRLTPNPAILERRLLMFQLLSALGRRQIERDARGSSATMPKIAQHHIRSWRVLIPPRDEQQCIVKVIRDAEKAINGAVKDVRAELSLLREYRTRLIADVVTGKIDVREAAAALPKEPHPSGNDRAEVEVDAGIRKEALEMTDWGTCPAVERNPRKISGAWAFTGTRVPVYALFENLESGATVKQFLEWFPDVKEWQVAAVLHHEAEHLKTTAQV